MNLRHRAFTVVELLVVIAIIAVLAGILFPVFARAKDNGLRVNALSNAKQLGTGMMLYIEEHDNRLLPSTNYGVPESAPERMWQTVLEPQIKSEAVFVAPGSKGKYAGTWADRGWMTIGYNSSTAVDKSQGCSSAENNCVAFKSAAEFDKNDAPSAMALFAMTPEGEVDQKYLGYEFSPYNGQPYPEKPEFGPPMVSDRDLVKENGNLPAEMLKPIYCRYLKTGSDDGTTPVIFGDGHAKDYSAKQIADAGNAKIVWRLR